MADQTPSAGPAPVTYSKEEHARLVAEACTLATRPGTLLLPTIDHVRAMFAQMSDIEAGRAELMQALIALILDQGGRPFVVIPQEVLAQVRVSGLGLACDTPQGLEKYRRYTVVRPANVGAGSGVPS
ncbi:MAG: hypothetical protein IT181_13000 [Acidobacteria bacterium]|nr:hypothetical protein [Acidobacteriota bacterium]